MKKNLGLILILIIIIAFFAKYGGGNTLEKKYILNKTVQKFNPTGKKDTIIITSEEIIKENEIAAYTEALSNVSSFKSDNKKRDNKFPQLYDSLISFELLNNKNKNVADLLSKKIKDSLIRETIKMQEYIDERFKEIMERPLKKTNISSEKFKSLLSGWDGSMPSLVEYVESRLHNPSSFEHVETGFSNKGTYAKVRMIYRAENGFGALRKSYIIAKIDGDGNIIQILEE